MYYKNLIGAAVYVRLANEPISVSHYQSASQYFCFLAAFRAVVLDWSSFLMWGRGGEEFTDGMIMSVFLIDAVRYDALRTFLGFDLWP